MARNFDGVNDHIDWGDGTWLDGATQATIYSWIRLGSLSGDQSIIDKWGAADPRAFLIFFDDVDGAKTDVIRSLIRDSTDSTVGDISSDSSVSSSTWHLCVITYRENNASGMNGYMDGTAFGENPQSTSGGTGGIQNVTREMYVGERVGGTNDFTGQTSYQVLWDTEITNTAHISAMARGANPFLFYDSNMKFFTTNEGNDTEKDYIVLGTGTVTGATKATTNAPVEMLENYL